MLWDRNEIEKKNSNKLTLLHHIVRFLIVNASIFKGDSCGQWRKREKYLIHYGDLQCAIIFKETNFDIIFFYQGYKKKY